MRTKFFVARQFCFLAPLQMIWDGGTPSLPGFRPIIFATFASFA
jgi:hypothetical protein